jgi:hypothetical protein
VATLGIIACSASKLDINDRAPAQDLYTGQLFRKAKAYVENTCDAWVILSGAFHVVQPEALLLPYNVYLPKTEPAWQRIWTQQVGLQLADLLDPADDVICLAAAPYCRWIPGFANTVSTPLAGLGIGQQLGWLTRQNAPAALAA